MFRQFQFLLGACLMVVLLSAHSVASAQDLTAGAEQPDHTFWQNIKDTTLPDLFAMFIERYPNSTHRLQAEQRLKRLQAGNQPSSLEQARQLTGNNVQTGARVRGITPMPKTATRSPVLGAPVLATAPAVAPTIAPAPAPAATQTASKKSPTPLISLGANGQYFTDETSPETILLIQYNLKRVGCMLEKLDGKWGPNSQEAAAHFAKTIDQPLVTITPNTDLLRVLKNHEEGTCPPIAKPAPIFKRQTIIRKTRRAVKAPRIIRRPRAAQKRRTSRPRARARRKAKSRKVRKARRANRRKSNRRNAGRSRRNQRTVSRGRANRGGGQKRRGRSSGRTAGSGGGGQTFSAGRAPGGRFGGGQKSKPNRGGSNGGGGQRLRRPGRGAASNGGGGRIYSKRPSYKVPLSRTRPSFRRPSIRRPLIIRKGGFGGLKLNRR